MSDTSRNRPSTRPQDRLKRREVLKAAAAGVAGTAIAGGTAGAAEDLAPIRRIVTVEGADGRSKVLSDGAPPVSFDMNGTVITRLWETAEVPATLPITEDMSLTAGNAYREGFVGTSFYISDIPGRDKTVTIPMHKELSVDYMAILAGEIYLILDDEEVLMKTGDVLVQGGNNHTWENRSDEICRLLVVVQTAREIV